MFLLVSAWDHLGTNPAQCTLNQECQKQSKVSPSFLYWTGQIQNERLHGDLQSTFKVGRSGWTSFSSFLKVLCTSRRCALPERLLPPPAILKRCRWKWSHPLRPHLWIGAQVQKKITLGSNGWRAFKVRAAASHWRPRPISRTSLPKTSTFRVLSSRRCQMHIFILVVRVRFIKEQLASIAIKLLEITRTMVTPKVVEIKRFVRGFRGHLHHHRDKD